MDAPQPAKPVRKLPQNWHAIDAHHPGHKGIKDEVIAEMQKDDALDADLKAYLMAKIAATNCKAIEVHAHSQLVRGEIILSVHIKPLF